uniref:RNase H type-1 domain-containing protein n=1 Tax=Aegilops tauschii subsp. strangulata TaxID=200361 RepID=A0A453RN71_AEGTS
MHACSEALALARDLNLQNLVITSDCLEVISNINNNASPVYAPIIKEILVSRNSFLTVSFRFERRDNNFEAHSIAKGAASLSMGRHVWLGICPNIACISDVLNFE